MALGHTACTHAADNLIFSREAIKAIARKHGLLATFVPKYVFGCLINNRYKFGEGGRTFN